MRLHGKRRHALVWKSSRGWWRVAPALDGLPVGAAESFPTWEMAMRRALAITGQDT